MTHTAAQAAQFSAESSEHYTPRAVTAAARVVLGAIDLDPFSCPLANRVVGADMIYTAKEDGYESEWGDGSTRVFCNPPGDSLKRKPAQAPKAIAKPGAVHAWWKLLDEVAAGRVDSAIFVAFNPDLFQTGQRFGYESPVQFPLCVPRARLRYWKEGRSEDEGSAPRSSAVILIPPRVGAADAIARFRAAYSPLGAVSVPA